MARLFNYFPTTFYSLNDDNASLDLVTNIIARFSFENSLKENTSVFYKYSIQDGDTPEIIAAKFYDNPERHWIVLLFNDIIDPQFDWPLDQRTLIKYIDKKYEPNATSPDTGLSWAMNVNNVQAYYKIITRESSDGTKISERINIDQSSYANVALSSTTYTLQNQSTVVETITKEIKTFYEYEVEENEKKRSINLLKPELLPAVEKEFKRVIRT